MATLTERDAGVLGALAEVFPTWQGEGIHVGRRHLFVRLAGCEVGCRFCDTPAALRRPARFSVRAAAGEESHDNPVDAARAAALILDVDRSDGPFHRLAVTGGEPLEQPAFLADLLRRLREGGAPPVLLETAGTEPEALAEVIGSVATVSMDVKLPSVAATTPGWDTHRRFLEIASRVEAYVKIVVNDQVDPRDVERAIEVVRAVDSELPFLVQPETRRDGGLAAKPERLAEVALAAERGGLTDVRIVPQVHKGLGLP